MSGVPIARLAGIEIRVQLGWVFIVALVAVLAVVQVAEVAPELATPLQYVLGGAVGVAFFLSALLHDLAHAVTARRRGVAVESILISFFGGTTPDDPSASVAADDLAIAVSGPAVSTIVGLALAFISVPLSASGSEIGIALGQILAVLAALNVLIGVINLIPSYPLDGGRIVRALVWRRTGSLARGWAAAATAGRLSGFVTLALGGGFFLTGQLTNGGMVALSGWFLILSSRSIRERQKIDALIGDLTVSDGMERSTTTVSQSLTVDTLAAQLLDRESSTTAIPVTEDGAVVGILGVRELRRLRRGAWPTTNVAAAMARPPRMVTLTSTDGLLGAVERLYRTRLDGVPVVDDGRLVGVLTRRSVGALVRERSASALSTGGGSEPT